VTLLFLLCYRKYVIGEKYASKITQKGGNDERIEE
jgi:hypothetical protein